ncbi:hypothetical protein [Nocardia noduli]|uniref:hypothetical protein n=1 Tax=Nocardia noduli TaxID=2815722 RepID=UPI001C223D3D|nr:hypothetical protein [Nocardia noduli]
MPKPYPKEFRDDVVRVARNREPGQQLKQIAADFGISESCLAGWLKAADVEDGAKPGITNEQSADNAEPRKRIRLLEQENEVLRRGLSLAGEPAGKMMYPLVRELAADGIPVAVTCRVFEIARQPYYRWLADPVTNAELEQAYRANALFDALRDDPEFGYRFLADEAAEAGQQMASRTAWRICSINKWWSSFGKKRGAKNRRSGPPVHNDLVERNFTADSPNALWLTDITEHHTGEGKLYLCAIKDGRSQGTNATLLMSSFSFSRGVWNPRVLRGRLLS